MTIRELTTYETSQIAGADLWADSAGWGAAGGAVAGAGVSAFIGYGTGATVGVMTSMATVGGALGFSAAVGWLVGRSEHISMITL